MPISQIYQLTLYPQQLRLTRFEKDMLSARLCQVFDPAVPIEFRVLPSIGGFVSFNDNHEPERLVLDETTMAIGLHDQSYGWHVILSIYQHEVAHIVANTIGLQTDDGTADFEQLLQDTHTASSYAINNQQLKIDHYEIYDCYPTFTCEHTTKTKHGQTLDHHLVYAFINQ